MTSGKFQRFVFFSVIHLTKLRLFTRWTTRTLEAKIIYRSKYNPRYPNVPLSFGLLVSASFSWQLTLYMLHKELVRSTLWEQEMLFWMIGQSCDELINSLKQNTWPNKWDLFLSERCDLGSILDRATEQLEPVIEHLSGSKSIVNQLDF